MASFKQRRPDFAFAKHGASGGNMYKRRAGIVVATAAAALLAFTGTASAATQSIGGRTCTNGTFVVLSASLAGSGQKIAYNISGSGSEFARTYGYSEGYLTRIFYTGRSRILSAYASGSAGATNLRSYCAD